MYDKEKRKGVPTRGMLYLAAGVVIGVVGMMLITLVVNRVGQPDAEPTSLPVIPTPAMGVTGTAAAQTAPNEAESFTKELYTFTIDEVNDQIALSYKVGLDNVVDVRPWRGTAVGSSPILTLVREPQAYTYNQLSLNTRSQPATLMASSFDGTHMSIFDVPANAETVMRGMAHVTQAHYSPNGAWMAVVQDTYGVKISRTPPGYFETVPISGEAVSLSFSPDSQMLAVVSMDKEHSHRWRVEVFRLPPVTPVEASIPLTPVKSYIFEASVLSPLVFSPDNIHMAVVVDRSIRILSVEDDEQRYFDVGTAIARVAIDPTGEWLAVSGLESGTGEADEKYVTFYPLREDAVIPPERLMVQSLLTMSDIVGIQFVEQGFVIGEESGKITLWQWIDDAWSEPVTIMENLE